jgi:hypothetical protein
MGGHLTWGAMGRMKGVVTYSLSPFEQRAFAGLLSKVCNIDGRFLSHEPFLSYSPNLFGFITSHPVMLPTIQHCEQRFFRYWGILGQVQYGVTIRGFYRNLVLNSETNLLKRVLLVLLRRGRLMCFAA